MICLFPCENTVKYKTAKKDFVSLFLTLQMFYLHCCIKRNDRRWAWIWLTTKMDGWGSRPGPELTVITHSGHCRASEATHRPKAVGLEVVKY